MAIKVWVSFRYLKGQWLLAKLSQMMYGYLLCDVVLKDYVLWKGFMIAESPSPSVKYGSTTLRRRILKAQTTKNRSYTV
jgi:hypothetical protein